jgi:hypothetical protein
MAQFQSLAVKDASGGGDTAVIVNLDRIRYIDQIRQDHCRLVFAPDDTISLEGAPARALLGSVANKKDRLAAGAASNGPAEDTYRLQVRESSEGEWREFGATDSSTAGLTCGRLIANNECAGLECEGTLHVRLVDAAGETIWMMD